MWTKSARRSDPRGRRARDSGDDISTFYPRRPPLGRQSPRPNPVIFKQPRSPAVAKVHEPPRAVSGRSRAQAESPPRLTQGREAGGFERPTVDVTQSLAEDVERFALPLEPDLAHGHPAQRPYVAFFALAGVGAEPGQSYCRAKAGSRGFI